MKRYIVYPANSKKGGTFFDTFEEAKEYQAKKQELWAVWHPSIDAEFAIEETYERL